MNDIFDRAFLYDPSILNRYTAPGPDLRTAAINARADSNAATAAAAGQTLSDIISGVRDANRAQQERNSGLSGLNNRNGLGEGLGRPFGSITGEAEESPFQNTGPASRIGDTPLQSTARSTRVGGLVDFNTFRDIISTVSGTDDGRSLEEAVFGLEPRPGLAEQQRDFLTASITGEFPSEDDIAPEDIEEAGNNALAVNHDVPDGRQHLHLPNGDVYYPGDSRNFVQWNGATFFFPGQETGFFAEGLTHISRDDDFFSVFTPGNRRLFADNPLADIPLINPAFTPSGFVDANDQSVDTGGLSPLTSQFYLNGSSFFLRGSQDQLIPLGVNRFNPDDPSIDDGDQFTQNQFVADLNIDDRLNPFYRSRPDYTFPDGTSFFYRDDIDSRSINDNLDPRLTAGIFRSDGSSADFLSSDSYFYSDGNKTWFRDGEDYYVANGNDFFYFSGSSFQYRSSTDSLFARSGSNFNVFV